MNKSILIRALTVSGLLLLSSNSKSQQPQSLSFASLLPATQLTLTPGQLEQTFTLHLPTYSPTDSSKQGLYELYTFTPTAGPLTSINPHMPKFPVYFLIQTTNQVGQTNQAIKTVPSGFPKSPGINLWVMSPAYSGSPAVAQPLNYSKPIPATYYNSTTGQPGCMYQPPLYVYNNTSIPGIYPIPDLGPNSTLTVTITAEGTFTIKDSENKTLPVPMGCITGTQSFLSCSQS